MRSLRGYEFMGHSRDEAAATLFAEVSDEADKLGVIGGEGGDVVPLVVGVCARESLASGDGRVAVFGEHHLHALVIIWVDDGRDVEVRCATEAVEAELGQHARHVWGTFGDGVDVTDPVLGEGLVGGVQALNDEIGDFFQACLGGDDDGSFSAVLVDEVNAVDGCCHGCERGGCKKDVANELHFERLICS